MRLDIVTSCRRSYVRTTVRHNEKGRWELERVQWYQTNSSSDIHSGQNIVSHFHIFTTMSRSKAWCISGRVHLISSLTGVSFWGVITRPCLIIAQDGLDWFLVIARNGWVVFYYLIVCRTYLVDIHDSLQFISGVLFQFRNIWKGFFLVRKYFKRLIGYFLIDMSYLGWSYITVNIWPKKKTLNATFQTFFLLYIILSFFPHWRDWARVVICVSCIFFSPSPLIVNLLKRVVIRLL